MRIFKASVEVVLSYDVQGETELEAKMTAQEIVDRLVESGYVVDVCRLAPTAHIAPKGGEITMKEWR